MAWEEIATKWQKRWAEVRGPSSVAQLSMVRVGWTWCSPFTFKDDLGRMHTFTDTSPGMVFAMAVSAYTRKFQTALCKTMGAEAYCNTEGPRSLLAARSSQLTWLQKGMLQSFLVGAVWPNDRLYQMGFMFLTLLPVLWEVGHD